MVFIHLFAHGKEGIQRHTMELFLASADGERNGVLRHFLIADDHDVRILQGLEGLDFLVHVLIGVVGFNTDTDLLQGFDDLLSVLVMLGADRYDRNLIRIQPEGEGGFEVFDDDADEALKGSEDRPRLLKPYYQFIMLNS